MILYKGIFMTALHLLNDNLIEVIKDNGIIILFYRERPIIIALLNDIQFTTSDRFNATITNQINKWLEKNKFNIIGFILCFNKRYATRYAWLFV